MPILKTKTFRIVAVFAVLTGLYALAGFVIAPKVMRTQLTGNIQRLLGVTPAVGDIRFNPFLLQLEVKDFALPDKAGAKLLGFDRLFLDVKVSASLWRRALVFDDIEIAAPYLHAAVARDGSMNLMQLRPATPSPVPPQRAAKSGPLPSLQIGSFSVTRGLVTYDDQSRGTPFAVRLEPIDFELRNFTTGADGGRFTFSGSSRLGELIEWRGHLSVQPVESDGELRIEHLRAQTIWDYVEDRVAFGVNSGTIDLSGNYRFSLTNAVNLSLDALQVAVTDLAIRAKGADTDWIVVPSLKVAGGSADLAKHAAHVDSVVFTGLKVQAWLEADRSLNLAKLAGASPAGTVPAAASAAVPPPGPPAPAPTAPNAAPAAWQFDLGEFAIRDASIDAADRSTSPAAALTLTPFSLSVTKISSDFSKPLGVALATHVNGGGELTVNGEVTPQPAAANLAIKLANIPLEALQPYLDQKTSMTLRSGSLSGETTLQYGAAKPTLVFAGGLSVETVHTIDNALHDDFIRWSRLDIVGLKFQQNPDRLDIERIVARKPYARVIVESDASLNVKRILAGPAGAAHAAVLEAAVAPISVAEARTVRVGHAHRNPASGASAASKPPQAARMPMSIRRIEVHSGEANFSDLSISPNFSAGIQALDGTVSGLSSRPNSRAKVDFHGEAGPFAPVAITGDISVLGDALYTDLSLGFRNMELSMFNPYSGKFAGYDIAKGKLTTELHYKIVGRALDAKHHITIDQLEFGDKTASKDAVSLPVKLAVSLLKDRNGVIDLDLPVTGSLDDPAFRLGPLVWKVLLNLLVKAVTAPFALLGSLFGSGPDLQFIDFRAGDSTLDGPAADKVKTVAKALLERPQLKLEVPIAAVPQIDRPALAEAKYRAELRQTAQAQSGAKAAGKNSPGPDDLAPSDPKAKLAVLSALYEREMGAAPKFPAVVAGAKPAEIVAARVAYLTDAVKAHVKVDDADLQALAQQRATVLQQALLSETQLDPARVFLVVNDKAKAQDGLARLELALQ